MEIKEHTTYPHPTLFVFQSTRNRYIEAEVIYSRGLFVAIVKAGPVGDVKSAESRLFETRREAVDFCEKWVLEAEELIEGKE